MGLWVRNAHFYFEKLGRNSVISYIYYYNPAITIIRQKLVKLHFVELSRILPSEHPKGRFEEAYPSVHNTFDFLNLFLS